VYSWLDCEPDDLYKQTRYSLYEIEDAFPQPIPDYLDYWRQNGLGMQHISPWLTSIGQFSFTARPMQVCLTSIRKAGLHVHLTTQWTKTGAASLQMPVTGLL